MQIEVIVTEIGDLVHDGFSYVQLAQTRIKEETKIGYS